MAFLKTKLITTNRNGTCNAYHCQSKKITKGDRVVWTLATYRENLIKAVWHPKCHTEATTFAPYWDQLLKIQQDKAAMPKEYYNQQTGLPLHIKTPK